MAELTIGEVARRAGLQTSAIRYYESVGLITPPRRVNGRRRYDEGVMQRLALIQLARNAGFRISELQVLLTGFSPDTPASARWQKLAAEKIAEMEALIERSQAIKAWLVQVRDQCQCVNVDDCASIMFDDAGNVDLGWSR